MKTYTKVNEILYSIQQAQRILINIHHNPDLDSVGTATAICDVLQDMGKKVTLVCPHKLNKKFFFLQHTTKSKVIDYQLFDFNKYDLLLIIDTANWNVASDQKDLSFKSNTKTPVIVIDHHKTNSIKEAQIRLIDDTANATGEIAYYLFHQWKIDITKDIATALYSAIIGDTVFLRYINKNTDELYITLARLIQSGANKKELLNFYANYSLDYMKLIGVFLNRLQFDPLGNFVFTAVNYHTYESYGKQAGVREAAADDYACSIRGAKFGLFILEEEVNKLMLSFRSTKIDVSQIAKLFNGGGHKHAAGAVMYGNFNKVLKEILAMLNSKTMNDYLI